MTIKIIILVILLVIILSGIVVTIRNNIIQQKIIVMDYQLSMINRSEYNPMVEENYRIIKYNLDDCFVCLKTIAPYVREGETYAINCINYSDGTYRIGENLLIISFEDIEKLFKIKKEEELK